MDKNGKKLDSGNKFLDLVAIILSFFISIFRSVLYFFGVKPKKRGIFFKSINFLFNIWPKYFWEKPSGAKIGSFLGDFIKYTFYNKTLTNKNEKS